MRIFPAAHVVFLGFPSPLAGSGSAKNHVWTGPSPATAAVLMVVPGTGNAATRHLGHVGSTAGEPGEHGPKAQE